MKGDRFSKLCRGKKFKEMTEEYIESCRSSSETASKAYDRFPNIAGFCRRFGIDNAELMRLKKERPDLYDHLTFTMEDEALNFGASPTLLSAYLKRRLGYADRNDTASVAEVGEMRLIFEHDINEDGI